MTSNDPAEGRSEPKSDFPSQGRIAAVDFGAVRIGIAVCDPDRILASPLEVHRVGTENDDATYFRQLARDERIAGFVVGLPIHCDGGESQKSIECRQFARWLAEETGKPVRLFDERFTTADASARIRAGNYTNKKRKKRIDAVAALVLLEAFLEACRYRGTMAGDPITAPPDGNEGIE